MSDRPWKAKVSSRPAAVLAWKSPAQQGDVALHPEARKRAGEKIELGLDVELDPVEIALLAIEGRAEQVVGPVDPGRIVEVRADPLLALVEHVLDPAVEPGDRGDAVAGEVILDRSVNTPGVFRGEGGIAAVDRGGGVADRCADADRRVGRPRNPALPADTQHQVIACLITQVHAGEEIEEVLLGGKRVLHRADQHGAGVFDLVVFGTHPGDQLQRSGVHCAIA